MRPTYPLEVVDRSESVFVKINPRWRPDNSGSVLVMPVDHCENIFDLPDALAAPIHSAARSAAAAMKLAFGCDGISHRQHNESAGSQDVWHYHLHVISVDTTKTRPASRHRSRCRRDTTPSATAAHGVENRMEAMMSSISRRSSSGVPGR